MNKPLYSELYAGCPEGEDRAAFAEDEWDMITGTMKAAGNLTVDRFPMIDRLVRDRTEYHFLYAEVVSEPQIMTGPKGGQFVNMRWSHCRKLADSVLKLERQLRLTPATMERPAKESTPKKVKSAGAKAPSKAQKYLARIGTAKETA